VRQVALRPQNIKNVKYPKGLPKSEDFFFFFFFFYCVASTKVKRTHFMALKMGHFGGDLAIIACNAFNFVVYRELGLSSDCKDSYKGILSIHNTIFLSCPM